jgi:hypothetical protein
MGVIVLRVAIDTLEVSYRGELADGLAAQLDELKTEAQEHDFGQRFGSSGLFVQPKAFGRWKWRLACPDFAIVLSPTLPSQGRRPNAQIRLSAYALSTRAVPQLLDEAEDALRSLGPFQECSVSRVDVCADLQGWTPTHDEMLGMSCPASYRAIHLSGQQPQTFQYGKEDLVLRVYDKTAELDHSGKAWMPEVWRECNGYDASLPVTRVEAQLRSAPIKELAFTSARHLIAGAGSVLEWTLRDWCQLRIPSGDKKVTRWPEHPVWTQLRNTAATDRTCDRARRKSELLPLQEAARRLVGLVALSAANYGEANYIKALQMLSDMAEMHMTAEDIDFAAVVADKRKRLEAQMGWEPDVPF